MEAPEGAPVEDPNCEVCGEPVSTGSSLECGRCDAPYHVDCWHFVGRCSIFGCDSTVSSQGGGPNLPRPAEPMGVITIDESTRPPVRVDLVVQGWLRRVRAAASSMPRTLAAAGAGAVFAYTAMQAFILVMGHYFYAGALESAAWQMLMLGGVYGLVAPFAAPGQHRAPLRVAARAMAAWGIFLVMARVLPWMVGWSDLGGVMMVVRKAGFYGCVVTSILVAASVAEAQLGAMRPAAERLGRLALPARMLASWVLTWALILPLHSVWWVVGWIQHPVQLVEVAVWSLLAVGSGVAAIETGKTEYRKSLLAGAADADEVRMIPGSAAGFEP